MSNKLFMNITAVLSITFATISFADSASGLATGKRQHKPVTISKSIDKSTPILAKSVNSETHSEKTGYRLCPDGSMINPGEKCPEKNTKK